MNTNSNQLSWKDAPNWLKIIIVVGLINVLSFTVISFYLGGDALFGKEEQGLFTYTVMAITLKFQKKFSNTAKFTFIQC